MQRDKSKKYTDVQSEMFAVTFNTVSIADV